MGGGVYVCVVYTVPLWKPLDAGLTKAPTASIHAPLVGWERLLGPPEGHTPGYPLPLGLHPPTHTHGPCTSTASRGVK